MDDVQIRLKCLELALDRGTSDPVSAAAQFYSFVMPSAKVVEHKPAAVQLKMVASSAMRQTINNTCRELGVAVTEVLGARRHKSIVAARDKVIAAVYEKHPDASLPDIGRAFNKDHTSILTALRRVGAWQPKKVA